MPVQIGATAHNFSNPTGLLTDCHRRIEMFLRSLQVVADGPANLDEERRRALDLALRYFRESAPKHTADEEESLFPRLREINNEQVTRAMARVEELERDHREADALHQKVDELGTLWLDSGEMSAGDMRTFREAVRRLGEIYPHHIEVEDKLLFPAADQALSSKQKSEIAIEMAGRRSVKLTTL